MIAYFAVCISIKHSLLFTLIKLHRRGIYSSTRESICKTNHCIFRFFLVNQINVLDFKLSPYSICNMFSFG